MVPLTIRPVIVVPTHVTRPSPQEVISLRQCDKVFRDREIVLVVPDSLELRAYRELLPYSSVLRVEPHWMSSRRAYNRMMISPLLVNALEGYSHMLVHEPDAIVLRDELDYWCGQPQDYIGAPWFEGFATPAPDANVLGVGNSGFSLHRLAALKRLVTSRKRWYPYRQVAKDLIRGARGNKLRLHRGLIALGRAGQLRGAWNLYEGNCDRFWSVIASRVESSYTIAPLEQAVRFAWEVLPSRCMEMTRGQLPFGIHAWSKYDSDFLLPHLIGAGVDVREVENSITAA